MAQNQNLHPYYPKPECMQCLRLRDERTRGSEVLATLRFPDGRSRAPEADDGMEVDTEASDACSFTVLFGV